MKSKTTKSSFKIRVNSSFPALLLFVALLCSSLGSKAQDLYYRFNNVSLADALNQISSSLKINIAFDAQKLSTIKINKNIKAKNEKAVLAALLENTGQEFEFKHNAYLITASLQKQALAPKKKFHLVGAVSDKETGETLPYANIQVLDSKLYASTSASGTFSFKNVDDRLHLNISYLGYDAIDTLIALRDTMMNFKFKMNRKALMLSTFDIKAEKLSMIQTGKEPGLTSINPSSFFNLPNMGETDIFRTIQLLPGVVGSENSSELNIRGSSSDQNLVLLDGFTLYKLDHFFGSFAMINPSIIKDIQIYKGGFDSRYGERVSGIIDITGKAGNCYKPKVYGTFNQLSGNLAVELPVTSKLTLIAAGRHTYGNMYSNKLFNKLLDSHFGTPNQEYKPDQVTIEPSYYFNDFNVKISYSMGDKEKIALSAFGGKDRLENYNQMDHKDLEVVTSDLTSWENYGTSASWTKQWNESYFTNLQIGYSGYESAYTNKTVINKDTQNTSNSNYLPQKVNPFDIAEQNKLTDLSLSLKNTYLIDTKHQLDFGLLVRHNEYSFYKNSGADLLYDDLKQSAVLSSVFVQDRYTPTNKLTVKTGVRLDAYSKTTMPYLEPRLSINYQLTDSFALKFATGRYYQFLNKISVDQQYGYNRDFWMLANGSTQPVLCSNHFILGASYSLPNLFFDLEAYYKSTDHLQDYLATSPFIRNSDGGAGFPKGQDPNKRSQFISGNSEAYGIDLLMKYEREKYTSWISYSLSKSVQRFVAINQGEIIPSPYDQRHTLSFVNMVSVGKWNLSAVYTVASGKPYIISSHTNQEFQTQRIYGRLDTHQRVDLSANYGLSIKKADVKLGVSIINVLNTKYYYDIYTRDFDFDNSKFGQTTLVKSLGFTPNFFINFKF